ncbi:MAG: TonB-dependent receptor, partial [Acidobacteria bacterium]|nr:TonB-dependent receptor [Acidobacteriota bacterium]
MKPKRKLLAFVLGVGFMLTSIVAQQAKGQVLYGSIVGTVTDQTGAVVPGATVTITNTATGQSRGGTTDAAGVYSIPNLQEGNYDVSVTASGFKSYTQTGVRISINTVTRINASIQVGAVTESITVEASAAVLQTETSDVKVELNPTAVNNLPLSNYRNYQELVNLVPGATPARFQNAITDTPGRAMTSNINGQNRNSNNTRLDGSANVNIFLPHHTNYVAPAETIETVNIATNNFDAEQGIAGGAAITVTTKSGTNDFHGSAFALHENGAIRAFEWNENRVGLDQKPKSIRNIDGATAGGPIVKNKLFFFAGYEGTFERFSRTGTFSVPATDLRTGDFTRIFGDTVPALFDPYTGDPNGDGSDRTPFSVGGRFNIIPADRLNSATMTMLDLVPDPTDLTKDTNNFFNSGTQAMNRHNIDAKINWNRNEKHQLWFKYSVMDATVRGDFALGAAGGPCLCDGGSGEGLTLVQLATIGQTYTVSPTFLIDAAIGWSRMGQEVRGPDFGTNFGLDVLGIPGTNGPDPRESGMPPMRVDGFTPLGNNEGWSPIFRNDQSYTYNTNASWIKNKHELRFGFDLVHHHLNHWQPELGSGPRGAFNFRRDVTAAGTSGTDFHALASFLIGAPQGVGKSTQFIKQDTFENQFGVYIRDRWRLTPKLTLNLGLRWELYPNKRRSNGIGFESYDFATNEALIGGRGDLPKDLGVTYSKKLFAPRVGFAYQVTDSMVIRSGYGIAYNPMVFSRPLRGFFPFVVASDFVGANGFQPVTTDPNYVDAGIPNASLGPDVGILPICCPDISTGRAPLPLA